MRLDDDDRSNLEDRRGTPSGGGRLKLGLGGTLVVLVLSLVFKQDLFSLLAAPPGGPDGAVAGPAQPQDQQRLAAEAELEKTALASFNDVQRVWGKAYPDYRAARLVLFWDGTSSGCGDASSAMGPFYCPADERVYLDLGFYRELASRFGAPGQFAQAYVVAHELGHHLQYLRGIEARVREAQRRDPSRRDALSVRLELQADCLAGAWGRSARTRGLLDPGDLEQGLAAAAAVGDDRLQRAATGRVNPERFTHGSAAQRSQWFRRGLEAGDLEACDTFAGAAP